MGRVDRAPGEIVSVKVCKRRTVVLCFVIAGIYLARGTVCKKNENSGSVYDTEGIIRISGDLVAFNDLE